MKGAGQNLPGRQFPKSCVKFHRADQNRAEPFLWMKSDECREQAHPMVGEGASYWHRVRRLLLDEVLQGKHQILNPQLVLAQEETAGQDQAFPCIGGWAGGKELCMGLQTHVRLTCHGSHIKLPLGSTDLAQKTGLLSLPDAVQWPTWSKQQGNSFTPLHKEIIICRKRPL